MSKGNKKSESEFVSVVTELGQGLRAFVAALTDDTPAFRPQAPAPTASEPVEADHEIAISDEQFKALMEGTLTSYVTYDSQREYKTGDVLDLSNALDSAGADVVLRRVGYIIRSEDVHSSVRDYVVLSLLPV